jgi:sugar/nucleoside kinase (ribokinase family)
MKNFYVLGFDPVFLDILVTPFNIKGEILTNFPAIGEHIENTTVSIIPGGNSLNFAHALTNITKNVYFFCAANNFVTHLIRKHIPSLNCVTTTEKDPNFTVAIQFRSGEIQMNAVTSSFSIQDISKKSLLYLSFSNIVPFSNLGLNSHALILFVFISDFFIEMNKIFSLVPSIKDINCEFIFNYINNLDLFKNNHNDIIEFKREEFSEIFVNLSKKIFYFDPSTLKSFLDWEWLKFFLINKFALLPGFKIITLNENEYQQMFENEIDFDGFLQNQKSFLIIHEAKLVTIFEKSLRNKTLIKVPDLNGKNIISTVGAGDVFNAGLVLKFSSTFNIVKSVEFGIQLAQKFLVNGW